MSEDDVKGLTDKLGVVKISRLVNEVSLVLCKLILVPRCSITVIFVHFVTTNLTMFMILQQTGSKDTGTCNVSNFHFQSIKLFYIPRFTASKFLGPITQVL